MRSLVRQIRARTSKPLAGKKWISNGIRYRKPCTTGHHAPDNPPQPRERHLSIRTRWAGKTCRPDESLCYMRRKLLRHARDNQTPPLENPTRKYTQCARKCCLPSGIPYCKLHTLQHRGLDIGPPLPATRGRTRKCQARKDLPPCGSLGRTLCRPPPRHLGNRPLLRGFHGRRHTH